mmetsp:Transcript_18592/g.26360  ORF Transcript_18592/g.26360 Transcript_18592/m.26360 type:complete len:125 (+) Transcript_18592:458-832(+)|eukprot:CAMPEP_0172427112 /NCGR_PEP_ID=MMETSP1064-20121228/40647_1 /TAXON_ID=202472 /ORGANISM="Aulacoseira subarctica , Strain CCAP 1002/5" /LENGTH=124 /DNA_ID=CAMNT_0013171125 /DNA_START=783 /DNA_END=1157 /DNA_ORIENTATION=+
MKVMKAVITLLLAVASSAVQGVVILDGNKILQLQGESGNSDTIHENDRLLKGLAGITIKTKKSAKVKKVVEKAGKKREKEIKKTGSNQNGSSGQPPANQNGSSGQPPVRRPATFPSKKPSNLDA